MKGIVFGVSNKHSIGWAVAQAWRRRGYDVAAIFVQDERFVNPVKGLMEHDELFRNSNCKTQVIVADVRDDSSMDKGFGTLQVDAIDMVCHSIAYSPASALKSSSILNVSRQDFLTTMDISTYSLLSITKRVLPFMIHPSAKANEKELTKNLGVRSITCLTFNADSRRVYTNYGIMSAAKRSLEDVARILSLELGKSLNIRVNCVSAGPVNTLAARGIPAFLDLQKRAAKESCLSRNITQKEIADTIAFLSSPEASGITGQTIHVDAGWSVYGDYSSPAI